MQNIAIITARGGSKRIPQKNIKCFCGKPIIEYSISAALESGVFDEVMVSTDDETIAEISKKCGASVPFLRSAKNSDDYATTADVAIEVVKEYLKKGQKFDSVCCIYPTAPFVTSKILVDALSMLENDNTWAVLPVTEFSFPVQRSFVIQNDEVRYSNPEFEKVRSQDLESHYHDAGQFYMIKTDKLTEHKTLITPNTKAIIRPTTEVQDIDNESDWAIAEIKYNIFCKMV